MNEEQFLTDLINKHWLYIKALLEAHDEPEDIIKMIEFHYKTALEHGWKHCKEYYNTLS